MPRKMFIWSEEKKAWMWNNNLEHVCNNITERKNQGEVKVSRCTDMNYFWINNSHQTFKAGPISRRDRQVLLISHLSCFYSRKETSGVVVICVKWPFMESSAGFRDSLPNMKELNKAPCFTTAQEAGKLSTEEDENTAAETTHISTDVFQRIFLAQVTLFFTPS